MNSYLFTCPGIFLRNSVYTYFKFDQFVKETNKIQVTEWPPNYEWYSITYYVEYPVVFLEGWDSYIKKMRRIGDLLFCLSQLGVCNESGRFQMENLKTSRIKEEC